MTAIAQSLPRPRSSHAWRMLLIGCSGIALCAPASANDVIFSNAAVQPQTGQRTSQTDGVTQVALTGGGTASFVDAADFTLNDDGSIDLHKGTVTVAAGASRDTVVRMPEGLEGRVIGGVQRGGAGNYEGGGSAARFTVGNDRSASGHALTGSVRVGRAGDRIRDFRDGAQWRAGAGEAPRRTMANEAAVQPDRDTATASEPAVVAIGGDAGPVGAALNGIPVTLGDGLAAAGASSDIVAAGRRVELAAANPALETFPSGDLALLVAAAAKLETSYGGRPFNAAQADVIRAYLRFLASGGSGAQFLTAYSGFVVDYLDLIRAGGVPSGFASGAANAADIDAYLAFIARTGAITDLASRDRALAEAYLAFLASGANRDLFAASFTDLTSAYFAFLRAGGVPSQFTGASQDALAQSIAFLSQSGLATQLSAADQALIAAFLENGGIAFASQYRSALGDYFAFLASGRRPSEYQTLDQATLRAYLETLSSTGLFDTVLTDQAAFYRDYLTFLQAGGTVDGFAGLPANVFAGYAVQLDAYFAFLAAGNLPSQFDAADIAQLQAFIVELRAAGALDRFLAANRASFFADFSQFVAAGGNFDAFAGLNANIFAGYALDLRAYFDFLLAGGVPSSYTVIDQATIQQYLAALDAAGASGVFLDDLAAFYQAYFTFLVGGGNPDNFAQLPVPPDFPAFAAALNAYAAFLAGNGLPSDYTEADIAQLQAFFNSVLQSGQLNALLGDNAALLNAYFVFVGNGGAIDGFAGLPVFADYIVQLNAYFTFLAAGGFPADYNALDQATLNAYLAALTNAQGGLAGFSNLNSFFANYAAFVLGGGNPANFAGLPVYLDYVAALNAYFDFLAGGNLPSDYTLLDAATLEAYLAALAALQGGLGGFADLNAFFVDYFAFLQGGGNPDMFAGLPGGNGGGGPTDPGNNPTLVYAGGFDGPQPNIAFAGNGFDGQSVNARPLLARLNGIADASIAANGALQSYGGLISETGAASVQEISGDPNLLIGRFTDGTFKNRGRDLTLAANQGFHYLLARDITGALTLPSGVIEYDLLGATRPTLFSGTTAPGTFAANLAVEFSGPRARFGIDGTITMPGDSGFVYTFATLGGSANPNANPSSLVIIDGGINFAASGSTNEATPRSGSIDFQGFLGDPAANRLGVTYLASLSGSDHISGAAIFGRADNMGGGGAPQLSGGLGWLYGESLVVNGLAVSPEVNADGRILALTAFDERRDYSARTADLKEFGRVGEAVAWTRYFNGATANFTNSNEYLLVGTPAFNLPTSGIVAYDLIGGSAPANRLGATGSEGYFTGNLAVAFGATPLVGINFDVSSGTESYRAKTAGGAADPNNGGISIGANGAFTSFLDLTGLTGTSCTSNCSAQVIGGLFGDGAANAGFNYSIADRNGTANNIILGTAVFGTSGTVLAGLGTPPVNVPPATGTSLILVNQSPFTATTGIKYNLRGPTIGLNGFSADSVVSNADRGITSIVEGFRPRSIGTATATDISTNARFAIGRWTNGVYNSSDSNENTTLSATQGLHYLFAGPTMSGYVVPTTGRIDYDLIAATAPTIADGSLAPGQFQADMAILFGSTNRVAMEGSITMPRAGGDLVYGFATAGGMANAEQSATEFRVTQGRNVNFSILGDGITTSDNNCDANCTIQFAGYFAGADINQLGLTYSALTTTDATVNAKRIDGAAIFGNGVYDAGMTGGGGNSGTAVANQIVAYAGADVGIDMRELAEVTYDAGGAPIGYVWRLNDFTTENERPTIGTATTMEAGSRGDGLIGWTRWADGQGGGRYFGDTDGFTLPANGGFHIVAVDPATDRPTGGSITYQLAGSTSPTVDDASLTPGTFTGTMAIAFGATPTADFNFTVGIGGSNYNFGASGRPIETSGDFENQFGANGMAVSGTGSVCPTGACQANMRGALGGVGATAVGVSYNFAETGNEGLRTYGAAAFVAPGVGASGTGGAQTPAGVASVAVADWSRWTGGGQLGGQLGGQGTVQAALAALGQMPTGLTAADDPAPGVSPSQRDAAIREAELMMGAMIKFGGSTLAPR